METEKNGGKAIKISVNGPESQTKWHETSCIALTSSLRVTRNAFWQFCAEEQKFFKLKNSCIEAFHIRVYKSDLHCMHCCLHLDLKVHKVTSDLTKK